MDRRDTVEMVTGEISREINELMRKTGHFLNMIDIRKKNKCSDRSLKV